MTINKNALTIADRNAIYEGAQLVMQRYYKQQAEAKEKEGEIEANQSLNSDVDVDNAMVVFVLLNNFVNF